LGLRSNPLNIEAYTTYIPRLHRFDTTVFYDPLVWRTLTIRSTAGGSVVEPGEGEFDYMDKAVVTVSAVPDEGYYFVNWAGSGVRGVADPVAAGTTVTMEADYTLRANFERIRLTLYVDDNAPNDPAPNNPQVSDPNEDGTPEHPYDTIQEAIDIAGYRDTVLVYPGIYQEEIIFMGKAITVQGVAASDGIPILENPDDFAVSFYHGEESDSILRNFVIRNSFMAVFIAGSSPTITNLTVIDNKYGIEAYADSYPDISNSIFWNNTDGDLFQCRAWYSCIEVIDRDSDRGNIDADPLFVDPANGDYHLRSTRGRYWPEHDIWVLDNMTSSCIDAGDPTVDPSEEPMPNGGRINMGAYGRTAYASMNEPSVTGEELPPEVIEQVRCITGGFHDEESTWFVATYHNGSDYTITQITVNLGLTDEETGEQEWYRVVLGPLGAVIPPGETVVLAGDIGIAIGDRDFCWEVVEMLGYID
jgi:parallel beta-helix repeat protein